MEFEKIEELLKLINRKEDTAYFRAIEKIEKNEDLLVELYCQKYPKFKTFDKTIKEISAELIENYTGWKNYKNFWSILFKIRIHHNLISEIDLNSLRPIAIL